MRVEVDPPIRSPSATGKTGCRAPERAKKTSIQPTASAVSAVTATVALENSPKAIPEFWTWWIANSPATLGVSSSGGLLEARGFVNWLAAKAARATAPNQAHFGR